MSTNIKTAEHEREMIGRENVEVVSSVSLV